MAMTDMNRLISFKEVFRNKETMKNLLKRDKHELLEGLCTEMIFINEVLSPKNAVDTVSTNWWAVYSRNFGKDPIFFKAQYYPLKSTDILVMKRLVEKGLVVYYVYVNRNLDVRFILANEHLKAIENKQFSQMSISMADFIKKYHLKKLRSPLLADEKSRIESKQNKAIEYFEKEGVLKEVVFQRYFANYFLSVYTPAVMNIDGFILNEKGLSVYEIKFKYKAQDGTFGINKGLLRLFMFMEQKNVPVYHFILENRKNNRHITALDGLDKPELKKKFVWIYCKLERNIIDMKEKKAPADTSVDSRKTQIHYSVDASYFKKLKLSS
jgi:bisphosphoglycerate-dependent phosphoglycerate mutase